MSNQVFIDGKIEDQGEIVEYMRMRDERLNKKGFVTYADAEMITEALNKCVQDLKETKEELLIYKQSENAREKEFRELERKVYRLEQERPWQPNVQHRISEILRQDDQTSIGAAWLR